MEEIDALIAAANEEIDRQRGEEDDESPDDGAAAGDADSIAEDEAAVIEMMDGMNADEQQRFLEALGTGFGEGWTDSEDEELMTDEDESEDDLDMDDFTDDD